MRDGFWVYLLLCFDGTFYTGVTNDVERRFAEHRQGVDPGCYTFVRRPLRLVYAARFLRADEAIAWEKRVKGWSHRKKAALIRDDWAGVRDLARRGCGCPSTSSG